MPNSHFAIQTFESATTGLVKTGGSYLHASYQILGILPEHKVYFHVRIGNQHKNPRYRDYSVNFGISITHNGVFYDMLNDCDIYLERSQQGYYDSLYGEPYTYYETREAVLKAEYLHFEDYLQKLKKYRYLLLAMEKNGGSSYAQLVFENKKNIRGFQDFTTDFLTSLKSLDDIKNEEENKPPKPRRVIEWDEILKPLWSEGNVS